MEEKNYTTAFDELKTLVSEIESGEITIDELSEKVKRASELIAICKSKLTTTEESVRQILDDLNPTDEPF